MRALSNSRVLDLQNKQLLEQGLPQKLRPVSPLVKQMVMQQLYRLNPPQLDVQIQVSDNFQNPQSPPQLTQLQHPVQPKRPRWADQQEDDEINAVA